ncbi:MAG: glutamate--tRNA ligase [Planctomycetes bacterium]|nr:glutamate--tRNA ligase [Planctomycetota bacterium]MBI3834361.1 glutamate--tRNA ligase [Planctomycetota bacterium]
MNSASEKIRVRFAPSPTGYLHIGGARTVLFNWLLARKHGGAFVLRIEDTDQARNLEDSTGKIVEDMRWLGLQWDEGPEVGGGLGPYFQSRRLEIYSRHAEQLLADGNAYYAMETPEELAAMRESAKRERRSTTYIRPDPLPTVAEGLAAKQAGRAVVIRLKMPREDIRVHDEILGEVVLPLEQAEDFVLMKSDGFPTYHFACVVDDELMQITHVLRGQEHLMNTPKHIALQRALGFHTPRYAHLPVIFNMDGTKMSKRDKEKAIAKGMKPPEIDVHDFRTAGYLPEALLNFLALLGWSPGEELEFFDLPELKARFTIERVGKTNAKFDREKLISFNTTWATRVTPARLLEAFKDFARLNAGADSRAAAALRAEDSFIQRVLAACSGFRTFADVLIKGGFAFLDDDAVTYDAKAVEKVLLKNNPQGIKVVAALTEAFERLSSWSAESIDSVVQQVRSTLGLQMGGVAQPLRVAVTGNTISPSIQDTLMLLGRNQTLARLQRCLKAHGQK